MLYEQKLCTGKPAGMSASGLRDSILAASRLLANERTGRGGVEDDEESIMDPAEDRENEGMGGMEIWRLLPHLKGLPEAMLKKLPLTAVFQLNTALAKDQKDSAKMNVNARMAANAQRMVAKPTRVEAGLDNRRDLLHPARYLGGASCATTELWAGARKHIGEEGIVAIGNYDLDSVGCGGSVTPRGWQELHNPGSRELKLKLFYMPNVANSGLSAKKVNIEGGEDALSIGESMKEIGDLEGFKTALNTAREAMHSAMPWNRSISAVVGFMLNTNYLQQELGGNSRRAAILTEFTDYVLGRNALNWENGHNFLTTDELAHVWANWRGKRVALFASKPEDSFKKDSFKKDGFKKDKSDICRMYNMGKCRQQTDKECKTNWGRTLRHVCNKYTGQGGKMCEKDHTRTDHK